MRVGFESISGSRDGLGPSSLWLTEAPHSVATENSVLRRTMQDSTRSQPLPLMLPRVTRRRARRPKNATRRVRCISAIAQHGLALGSQSEPLVTAMDTRKKEPARRNGAIDGGLQADGMPSPAALREEVVKILSGAIAP